MVARSDREETFAPLKDKTLFSVLRQQFMNDFGYARGPVVADAIIAEILETVAAFVRPAQLLQPGQMLWMAVANDGRKHAHTQMREIPMVPVVLDLITAEELTALAGGEPYEKVRQQRQARLLEQTMAQGGVLAQSDVAAICLLHRKQVSRAIQRFQAAEGRILPYRGTVQDVGGTITHKVEVIRLFEAGHLENEICKLLPVEHSLTSVESYVQTYKHVLKLLERQFSLEEVSGILSISLRLVRAYVEIIREHHPDVLARHPHLQHQDDAPKAATG